MKSHSLHHHRLWSPILNLLCFLQTTDTSTHPLSLTLCDVSKARIWHNKWRTVTGQALGLWPSFSYISWKIAEYCYRGTIGCRYHPHPHPPTPKTIMTLSVKMQYCHPISIKTEDLDKVLSLKCSFNMNEYFNYAETRVDSTLSETSPNLIATCYSHSFPVIDRTSWIVWCRLIFIPASCSGDTHKYMTNMNQLRSNYTMRQW